MGGENQRKRVWGDIHIGGLHWSGRDSTGVSKWRGQWRTIPKWFTNVFKGLGIGLICLSGVLAAMGIWEAAPVLFAVGAVHTVVGFLLLDRMRDRLDGSVTVEQAAQQFGVGVEDVNRAIADQQIRPAYILNDEPVFSLHSFGDAGILLRSSQANRVDNANLLQAVGPRSTATESDGLLRADPGTVETITASVDEPAYQSITTSDNG